MIYLIADIRDDKIFFVESIESINAKKFIIQSKMLKNSKTRKTDIELLTRIFCFCESLSKRSAPIYSIISKIIYGSRFHDSPPRDTLLVLSDLETHTLSTHTHTCEGAQSRGIIPVKENHIRNILCSSPLYTQAHPPLFYVYIDKPHESLPSFIHFM